MDPQHMARGIPHFFSFHYIALLHLLCLHLTYFLLFVLYSFTELIDAHLLYCFPVVTHYLLPHIIITISTHMSFCKHVKQEGKSETMDQGARIQSL